jgi:uncharacterized membrane protein YecN with MAPEG domain
VRHGDGGHLDLANASRAHGNLVEHALPLLLLLLLWELQGASAVALTIAGALIVVARVLHATGFTLGKRRIHVGGAGLTYALEVGLSVTLLLHAFLSPSP